MKETNQCCEGLEEYFDLLFEASDRNNVKQGKLSIYDKMVRDEIQIAAEREYAVREGRAEGKAEGKIEGKIETARSRLPARVSCL